MSLRSSGTCPLKALAVALSDSSARLSRPEVGVELDEVDVWVPVWVLVPEVRVVLDGVDVRVPVLVTEDRRRLKEKERLLKKESRK